ncbi:MAG TPA: thiamine diphosphokinase [Ktedonobacteraceae bacterium]|nr:thiamine diphosphokinase [Ktedonobacteraceae bacterium]
MHIVIFAGGTLQPGEAVAAAIASADLIIAADGGAETALQAGCAPAIIIGDFDSLDTARLQQLKAQGSRVVQAAIEKDETDTELAILAAIEEGATAITLLGGLGGARFDHTMANILLLAGFPALPIRIVDGPAVCWLLRGPGNTLINGHAGDLLSLLPLTGEAAGVQTTGLYYPLQGETLRFGRPRGVSNVLTSEQARVSLENGSLLIIHINSRELGS